jgi:acetolactate synthase I/II/III large subunit
MDLQALAQQCLRNGLQYAFGIPGGGPSLQFIDALTRSGARFVTTGHETTAALMAGAVSRMSEAPSASVTIKGPGLMNVAAGLLSNRYEGYPMLSVSEAYGPSGGIRRHKWLAHEQVLGSFGKGSGYWDGTDDLVKRCWDRATSECPGPVHLELADGPGIQPGPEPEVADNPSDAMARVRRAERPVLVVGSLALRARWRILLQSLCVPIFTTASAKGVISEHSAYAAGVYTGDGKPTTPEKRLASRADLVIAIGVRGGEVLNPGDSKSEWIRLDAAEVRNRGVFPADAPGDVTYLSEQGFTDVLRSLQEKSWGEDEIAGAFADMSQALCARGWSPVRAYGLVARAFPEAVHVLDTGNFTVIGEHVLRVNSEKNVLGTPNGRYMGLGIGYALGAAIAAGSRPVVLWIGDGGIRAFFSELSLAVEQRLGLLVLVMADGHFGSIRGRAVARGWSTDPLQMRTRDIRGIAEAMGIHSVAAGGDDALAEGLEVWRKRPQPMLIRCDFESEVYQSVAESLR